jgi:hypothetical protein
MRFVRTARLATQTPHIVCAPNDLRRLGVIIARAPPFPVRLYRGTWRQASSEQSTPGRLNRDKE